MCQNIKCAGTGLSQSSTSRKNLNIKEAPKPVCKVCPGRSVQGSLQLVLQPLKKEAQARDLKKWCSPTVQSRKLQNREEQFIVVFYALA